MDLTQWPTVEEAAAALHTSTRSILRRNEEGKLEIRKRQRPGKKPENVCNPADVERLKPAPFVIQRDDQKPDPARVINIEAPSRSDRDAIVDAFIGSIAQMYRRQLEGAQDGNATIQPRPPHSVSIDRKLWLNVEEAAALSGYAESRLREAIAAGTVKANRGGPRRSWIIQRASLESFNL